MIDFLPVWVNCPVKGLSGPLTGGLGPQCRLYLYEWLCGHYKPISAGSSASLGSESYHYALRVFKPEIGHVSVHHRVTFPSAGQILASLSVKNHSHIHPMGESIHGFGMIGIRSVIRERNVIIGTRPSPSSWQFAVIVKLHAGELFRHGEGDCRQIRRSIHPDTGDES